ncbi:MAG: hypothetical protein ACO3B3_10795 [Cyanobium sp.]
MVKSTDDNFPDGGGGDLPRNADQAGEDPSNDASIRQEARESDDDASASQGESSSKRNWFPSSAGLSLIVEQGSQIEVTVTSHNAANPGLSSRQPCLGALAGPDCPQAATIAQQVLP